MKTPKQLDKISRLLTQALRHQPEKINIVLDENGWTSTQILIKSLGISYTELDYIVDNDNKSRFSYNHTKTMIKANQGHSLSDVKVELEEVIEPPEFLYHGTSLSLLSTILKTGIKKMNRNHVHLSGDIETAKIVGKRKSKKVLIFILDTKKMLSDNIKIFISPNNVYLTDFVDPKYLKKYEIKIED